ncbi:phenylalanine--tRNA ligase subunit beta [Chrysiogenes arsenatis]|uniref:phenylalanine--tRNA ligase subunit beta n=1 Tax=Chrysiogenes arsenatis TaxID=309797 RepID=UPI000424EFBA|nr:phenylalanine--tRNA ligase subunit beta [Chrysiogenes arsenatis]
MIVSYNWLREFTPLELSVQDIADRITLQGLEVDAIHAYGAFSHVVVGQITAMELHPNASKLTVCRVVTDESGAPLTIVCGATNMQQGDKVPVAMIGAVLPGGLEIKAAQLRGVDSQGMLCAKAELGLEEKSAGLYILPSDAPLGVSIVEYLGLRDTAIEIGLTPNRSDCLSHVGVAREVAVITGGAVMVPRVQLNEEAEETAAQVAVAIDNPEDCPRYMARIVRGITVAPSPQWLQNRLTVCGIRPINNIVDVTNYIMMGFGHPLHAFDWKKLGAKTIRVRRAFDGETLQTLDDAERSLHCEDIVITDGASPIALAGVMGGASTAVDAQSTDILIEAASFDGQRIRRTAKRLALHSESSHRFERGVDPNGCAYAIDLAAQMMAELGGGTVCRGAVDQYLTVAMPRTIHLRLERVAKILGTVIPDTTIGDILQRLGMRVSRAADVLVVSVPSGAGDVHREIDLIEEIARVYGFGNIPAILPEVVAAAPQNSNQALLHMLKTTAAALGYTEVINYSFTAPRFLDAFLGKAERVQLLNPLSDELSVMRTSHAPSLLRNLVANLHLGFDNYRFAEYGSVVNDGAHGKDEIPESRMIMSGLLSGKLAKQWYGDGERTLDFFDLKGELEAIAEALGVPLQFESGSQSWLHPGVAATIAVNGEAAGWIGELHPALLEPFDLTGKILLFELDLTLVFDAIRARSFGFIPVNRYPSVWRDLAFVTERQVSALDIQRAIATVDIPWLQSVRLFDAYDKLEGGRRSLAFRFVFRSAEQTLSDSLIDPAIQQIIQAVTKATGAVLR